MFKISDFLGKYKKSVLDTEVENSILRKIFLNVVGYEFNDNDFKIKNGVLFVKGDSYLKSEIFLRKDLIIKDIKKSGISRNILDIK